MVSNERFRMREMNRTYRRSVHWHDGVFFTQLLLLFSSLSSDANGRHREDNQCGEQEQDQSSARDAEAEGSCTVTLHGHFFFFAELSRGKCLSLCDGCLSARYWKEKNVEGTLDCGKIRRDQRWSKL
jgi:hypothetical protein